MPFYLKYFLMKFHLFDVFTYHLCILTYFHNVSYVFPNVSLSIWCIPKWALYSNVFPELFLKYFLMFFLCLSDVLSDEYCVPVYIRICHFLFWCFFRTFSFLSDELPDVFVFLMYFHNLFVCYLMYFRMFLCFSDVLPYEFFFVLMYSRMSVAFGCIFGHVLLFWCTSRIYLFCSQMYYPTCLHSDVISKSCFLLSNVIFGCVLCSDVFPGLYRYISRYFLSFWCISRSCRIFLIYFQTCLSFWRISRTYLCFP